MFAVDIDKSSFEYDVNALVSAFFSEEGVKVLTPDTGEAKREEFAGHVRLRIAFEKDGARLAFSDREEIVWRFAPEEDAGSGKDSADDASRDAAPGEGAGDALSGGKAYKKAFKRFLYRILSEYTGKTLPWGALTGIRPTKMAMELLESGKSVEEAAASMEEEYFVSEEKARLSADIAARERKILSGIHYRDGYSLYIGIPFCPTTCLYCSFTSYPICRYKDRVQEYLDCLVKEMECTAGLCEGKTLDSVYIGGGTPTTLSADELDFLLGNLKRIFDFSTVQEFTVEAGRADSITAKKLEVLKKYGVGRISINPQTMNEKTLHTIGRQATAEQVKEAFLLARGIDCFNINMDIILGLPGEEEKDVRHTIEEIVKLRPDSLTVHSLAIKRASRLAEWIRENGVQALKNTEETMAIAQDGARRMNMQPYYLYRQKNMSGNFENVGYATEGNYGIYNILIMEEVQTIYALGAGSITKVVCPDGRIERCENVKDVGLYMDKIEEMTERKRKLFEGEKYSDLLHQIFT